MEGLLKASIYKSRVIIRYHCDTLAAKFIDCFKEYVLYAETFIKNIETNQMVKAE